LRLQDWYRRQRREGWLTGNKIKWVLISALTLYVGFRFVIYIVMSIGIPVSAVEVVPEHMPVHIRYVGMTDAIRTLDVRARVEGFLEKRAFEEGSDVKKDDLLYIIEQGPYEANLAQAKAKLAESGASLTYADEQVARYGPLAKKGYVSKE